jgi:hypothetical protein
MIMDSWRIFCAKHRARKQEILVKQKQERLELLQKQKAELEAMDLKHKETIEDLKELFEKDRVQRKESLTKKSKKNSVLNLKRRSCKVQYLSDSNNNTDSDDDINGTQNIQNTQNTQITITKFLKKKLTRAADSVELIKSKAEPSNEMKMDIPSAQNATCIIEEKCYSEKSSKVTSDLDEEICRILNYAEKLVH